MIKRLFIVIGLVALPRIGSAAFPVILVDTTNVNATDFKSSGAGPTTAIFGSTWSTDATGVVVSINGSPNLTNVSTDGSHVLFLQDENAGHRNFARITGKDGSLTSTATITVSEAFSISMSSTAVWAIGGVRATVASTTSVKILNNNTAAGDAMPGWTVEMQSGHTETVTAELGLRRSGDTTSGPITLRGKSGAAVKPVISANGNINTIVPRGSYQVIRDFTISAVSNPVISAVVGTSFANYAFGMTLTRTSSNKFTTGISNIAQVRNCEVAFCTTGISGGGTGGYVEYSGNYIHDITGNAIDGFGDTLSLLFLNNTIDIKSGVIGINIAAWGVQNRGLLIQGNTIDGGATATGAGIKFTVAPNLGLMSVINNTISNMGTYAVDFSNASSSDASLIVNGVHIEGNNTYLNTSNAYHSATGAYSNSNCPWASGDSGLNPTYTGGTNYTPTNTALKGTAYPTTIGAVTNYQYPGSIQPNSTGSAATTAFPFVQ